MKTKVPQIFDQKLRRKFHQRNANHIKDHGFIFQHVAQNINERLLDIQRTFSNCLVITPHPHFLASIPALQIKAQKIITASPSIASHPHLVLDEEQFPFKSHSFDLIITLGGLHVVNDLPGTLIQIRKTLMPNGFFLGTMAGGETLQDLRQAFLYAEMEKGTKAHIHPCAQIREVGDLLQRTGFALPVADCDTLTVNYQNPLSILQDLRYMGEGNILHERSRRGLTKKSLFSVLEEYQSRFSTENGKLSVKFDIYYLSAWAPHKSQQKPLPRGSAKTSLAYALGTKEEKL